MPGCLKLKHELGKGQIMIIKTMSFVKGMTA